MDNKNSERKILSCVQCNYLWVNRMGKKLPKRCASHECRSRRWNAATAGDPAGGPGRMTPSREVSTAARGTSSQQPGSMQMAPAKGVAA